MPSQSNLGNFRPVLGSCVCVKHVSRHWFRCNSFRLKVVDWATRLVADRATRTECSLGVHSFASLMSFIGLGLLLVYVIVVDDEMLRFIVQLKFGRKPVQSKLRFGCHLNTLKSLLWFLKNSILSKFRADRSQSCDRIVSMHGCGNKNTNSYSVSFIRSRFQRRVNDMKTLCLSGRFCPTRVCAIDCMWHFGSVFVYFTQGCHTVHIFLRFVLNLKVCALDAFLSFLRNLLILTCILSFCLIFQSATRLWRGVSPLFRHSRPQRTALTKGSLSYKWK